jgi:hypothetical protein
VPKIFPLKLRRADKRPAPEAQHDAHVDTWLASDPPKPPRIKRPRPHLPPQHDAHMGEWRLEQRIEAQIRKFTEKNFAGGGLKLCGVLVRR